MQQCMVVSVWSQLLFGVVLPLSVLRRFEREARSAFEFEQQQERLEWQERQQQLLEQQGQQAQALALATAGHRQPRELTVEQELQQDPSARFAWPIEVFLLSCTIWILATAALST